MKNATTVGQLPTVKTQGAASITVSFLMGRLLFKVQRGNGLRSVTWGSVSAQKMRLQETQVAMTCDTTITLSGVVKAIRPNSTEPHSQSRSSKKSRIERKPTSQPPGRGRHVPQRAACGALKHYPGRAGHYGLLDEVQRHGDRQQDLSALQRAKALDRSWQQIAHWIETGQGMRFCQGSWKSLFPNRLFRRWGSANLSRNEAKSGTESRATMIEFATAGT